MNFFDDEIKIIDIFQDTFKFEVCFPFKTANAIKVFNSVYKKRNWKKWTNNSGKSNPPPDFFSDRLGLMMEVMRIDDHAHFNKKGILVNPVNQRESMLQKELREKIKKQNPELDLTTVSIQINALSGLPSNEDHNYQFYYDNFRRVLEKHINNIPLYRKNHPDKKLIFFVFDESTGYLLTNEDLAKRGPVALEQFLAQPLWHFYDKKFISVFNDADIDYLIWFTPYKMFHGSPIQPPKICVFDIKNQKTKKLIHYPEKYIVSSEA